MGVECGCWGNMGAFVGALELGGFIHYGHFVHGDVKRDCGEMSDSDWMYMNSCNSMGSISPDFFFGNL